MPTFIHAADLHLDSPLQRLEAYEGAPVEQIRLASRRALENLVELALARSVDLVVIAGDLYDGDWQDHNTGLFFVAQINRLIKNGIPVVAISGNHDAASQMTKSLPLPNNPDGSAIMLRSRSAETRRFMDIGISVHGRSFRNRAEEENMVPDYPAADPGVFNIGVLHTSLTGAEGHDTYAPCSPSDLVSKQYDYWALGHVHTRGEHHDVDDEDAAPIIFPGNLQGRHPKETGPKGCMIVEVGDDGKPKLEFHALDVVRWEVCQLDVADLENLDQLYDRYRDWLRDMIDTVGDRILAHRVRVVGATELHTALITERLQIENSLRAIGIQTAGEQGWLECLRVKTTAPQKTTLNFDPDGPLGCLEAVLSEMMETEQLSTLQDAFADLIRKLPDELTAAGDDALRLNDPETLRELIAAARPVLHAQLNRSEVSS
ncbi:metallophosphoesterase family protein [Roseimaritima ulvae]|uniref:Putative metallophosphoesterase YhaO n=1 Tax=Roseimaritima ulvae TaxID=980254 RepID=A0A5B9QQR5_9BACT|nr:DNA repair exonuclease [Roseimaritima ulvae]QEG41447.1 putative metallophosphoesterase YhaO [Roseimaritima ulvae]